MPEQYLKGSSRRKLDWEIGLGQMEKKGAMVSTTETIALRLKEARTEVFRRLYLNPLKQFGK